MARTSSNESTGPRQKRDKVPYAQQEDESDNDANELNEEENEDDNQEETEKEEEENNEESDEDNKKELNDDNEEDDEITKELKTKECRTEHIESDLDDNKDKTSEPKKKNPPKISVASGKDDHSTMSITSSLKSNERLKNEKEKKLRHYIRQEHRCKKRMKIKAEAYRLISADLLASESEAELEDKELEDKDLAHFRHEVLTRLYLKKGRKKKEVLIER